MIHPVSLAAAGRYRAGTGSMEEAHSVGMSLMSFSLQGVSQVSHLMGMSFSLQGMSDRRFDRLSTTLFLVCLIDLNSISWKNFPLNGIGNELFPPGHVWLKVWQPVYNPVLGLSNWSEFYILEELLILVNQLLRATNFMFISLCFFSEVCEWVLLQDGDNNLSVVTGWW